MGLIVVRRGPQGLQGVQGIEGPEGPDGPQGIQGVPGADGTGFVWRGNWNVATAYVIGDVVFKSPADPEGFTSFIAVEDNTGVAPVNTADEWDGITIVGPPGPQGIQGQRGDQGIQGSQGIQGPPGSGVSNAVLGQTDRFYKTLAGTVRNEGPGVFWAFQDDTESRPQNVDTVTSDSEVITLDYSSLRGSHIGSVVVTPDPVLRNAGIFPSIEAGVSEATIRLVQDKDMSDVLSWDGAAWAKNKDVKSPFTLTGLDGTATNFAAYVATLSPASYYRCADTSGASIVDSSGNGHTGTVVSTGVTYGVSGFLVNDGANKALKTAAGGSNELTFPLTGISAALFSAGWLGKLEPNATVVFRDGAGSTSGGYWVAYSATNGGRVAWRYGSTALRVTTYPWSQINDGNPHLVGLVVNGANVALYIDGVLIDSATNATGAALNSAWHVGRTGQNGSAVTSQSVTLDEFILTPNALSLANFRDLWYAMNATGILTVAHEEAGDTDPSAIRLEDRGDGSAHPTIAAVRTNGFDLQFLDGSGDPILGATSSMSVAVGRTISQRAVNPQDFTALEYFDPADFDPTVLASMPRSYWNLEEAAGATTAIDTGTALAHGTIQAGVTMGTTGLVPDDNGTAATFNGTQGKIALGDPEFIAGSAFSMMVVFKNTGASGVGGTQYATLFGWSTGGGTYRIMYDRTNLTIRAEQLGSTLVAPSGIAAQNATHLVGFYYDGIGEMGVWLDGELVATTPTTLPKLNNPLWLGSYLDPSTNYSFNGTMARAGIWNRSLEEDEWLQLWASFSKDVISKEAAVGSALNFYGLLETFAPLPDDTGTQPLPSKTPLPAGDNGGGQALLADVGPYRDSILSASAKWKTTLPADVASRNAILLNGWTHSGTPYAGATSDNWRRFLCSRHGYDPDTSQLQAVTNFVGASQGLAWADISEMLYVVPPDQPLREVTDTVVGFGAAVFNDVVDRIGGLPIPADARPHATGDRYMAIYSPSMDLMVTMYDSRASDPASVTFSPTGSPTAGSQVWKFLYLDSQYQEPVEFFCGQFIHHNATAAEIQAALLAAVGPSNRTFGSTATSNTRPGSNQPAVIVTGGPLNVAPITVVFPACEPLRCPGFTILENSFNAGTVHFTYHNSGPYDLCRLGAVIVPSLDGHVPGVSGFTGAYSDVFDNSSVQWRSHYWPATATSFDMFSLVPSIDELKAAQLAGTGLDHMLVMSTGQAQQTPFPYVTPATRGDGLFNTTSGGNYPDGNPITPGSAMAEGARLALSPDVDLSAAYPEMLPILMTMRDKGIMPIDKTGIGIDFGKFRTTRFPGITVPAGDDYTDYFTLYKTVSNASHLYNRNVPWHKMQVIDPNATW